MTTTWIKPAVWGVVIGSVATMILGFGWGGWMTGSGAERVAVQRSDAAVTAALVPVCLEKSKADPGRAKKLGDLAALNSSYDQRDAVLRDGWATVGVGEANRDVAEACVAQLLKTVAK